MGVARFNDVSYASLVDTITQKHFLLSTKTKSELDVALASVLTDADSDGPSAVVQKNGASVLLKLNGGASPLHAIDGVRGPCVADRQPFPGR